MRMPRAAYLLALLLGCTTAQPTSLQQQPQPVPLPAPQSSQTQAPAEPAQPAVPGRPQLPAEWPYPASAAPVTGANGMVVSDATIATNVGLEVLRSGGNAADAAVATAFALAVAYPTAGNIGGGGFIVARIDGAAHALDFRETAPAAATRDMYTTPEATKNKASSTGHLSAGVPGSVAGLWEAHQKLGSKKKTWAELLAPAIKLAEEGFTVDAEFAKAIGIVTKRLAAHPASAALFLPNGAPVAAGSTWKNPDLAKALRRIAEKGPAGFYEGPTAALIAAEMKRGKGLITTADLKAYTAKWRPPVEFTYRGHRVTSMPPPSSGGVTLAMMSHILEGYDLKKLGWNAPERLHLVVESMRRAFTARNARLGDPDFVKNPLDELLSPEWATAQRATIKLDRATPSAPAPNSGGSGPHTTHLSVVDGKGNAVALTTTVNWWFGSGVTVAGAGFVLNNEMDDFAAIPGTENGFGLVQGEPNAVGPKKRMLSSMAPTLVTAPDGHVTLVLGAAGGPTIITAVFQILSNVVDHGFNLTEAESAPRFHHQGLPDLILHEKHGLPPELRKRMEAMGHAFKEREHIADAPSIGWNGTAWIGAAEPRRNGSLAAGY